MREERAERGPVRNYRRYTAWFQPKLDEAVISVTSPGQIEKGETGIFLTQVSAGLEPRTHAWLVHDRLYTLESDVHRSTSESDRKTRNVEEQELLGT